MALDQDYGVRVENYAREQYPQAFAPAPEIPALQTMGGAAPASGNSDSLAKRVIRAQGTGPKLDRAKFDALREAYKKEVVAPRSWREKGAKQGQVEADLAKFDSLADEWYAKYAAGDAAGGGDDSLAQALSGGVPLRKDISVAESGRDFLKQAGGALVGIPANLAMLGDYGIRAIRGIANVPDAVESLQRGEGIRGYLGEVFGEPTALGRWGAETRGSIDQDTQNMMSEQYKAAQARVQQTDGFLDRVTGILSNPEILPGMLGSQADIVAGLGVLKIPAIAKVLQKMPTWGRAAAGAHVVGLPQVARSAGTFEAELRAMPFDELLKDNPDGQALYDSLKLVTNGDEKKAQELTRNQLVNMAVTEFGAVSYLANVTLAHAMPGTLERSFAGVPGAGRIRGAVSETLQEGAAGALETAGQNIAQNMATGSDIPILQGAGSAAGEGAVLGGILGGALGHGDVNPLARKRPRVEPTAEEIPTNETNPETLQRGNAGLQQEQPQPTQAATQSEAPATTLPIPARIIEGAGEGVENIEAELSRLRSSVSTRAHTKKWRTVFSKLDAGGLVEQGIAEAQKTKGWENMSPEQRIDAVDTAVEALRGVNNVAGVPEILAAVREQIMGGEAVTPAGPVTEAPVETPAIEPPVVETPTVESVAPVQQGELPLSTPAQTQTPAAETPAPTRRRNPLQRPAAPAPAPVEQAPVQEQPLPRGLAGAKPRYGAGYLPEFESDIDKALYTVGRSGKKSASEDKYLAYLKEQGIDREQINQLAPAVLEAVKAAADAVKAGTAIAPTRIKIASTQALQRMSQVEPTPEPPKPSKAKKNPIKKEGNPAKAKKNPLKGEAASPKAEAPVAPESEPGQTEEQPAAPENQIDTDTVQTIAPDLAPSQVRELGELMGIARQGDATAFNEYVKELQTEGDITPAIAKKLREAAKPATPAEEGLAVTETPVETIPESLDIEYQSEVPEVRQLLEDVKSVPNDGQRSVALLRGLAKLPATTNHERWLANKIADIISDMQVPLTVLPRLTAARWHGKFQAGQGVTIRTARPSTIIHEYIHAATAYLLLRKARNAEEVRLQSNLKALQRRYIQELGGRGLGRHEAPSMKVQEFITYALTDPTVRDFLQTMPPMDVANSQNLWQDFKKLLVNFWAKITGATQEQRTFLDSVIDASAELIEYSATKSATVALLNKTGITTTDMSDFLDTEIDAVENWLEDTADSADAATPSEPTKAKLPQNVDARASTRMQAFWKQLAQSAYGAELSEREVSRAGGTITDDSSPVLALRRFSSDVNEIRNTDERELVQDVADWITDNWNTFAVGEDVDRFIKYLDQFLQLNHAIHERNPTVWAENVPLTGRGEVERAEIIENAEGRSPQEVEQALKTLAQAKATQPFNEWVEKSTDAISPSKAQPILDRLAQRGFTRERLAPLNALLERIRTREYDRRVAAGVVSENDAFARRPSWQWYVPLKDEVQAKFNLGIHSKNPKALKNRNMKTVSGRQTRAANALESLLIDLGTAGTEQAEGLLKDSLFEYVTDNAKLLGARILPVNGTPKTGFTYERRTKNKKTGKVTVKEVTTDTIPSPKNGFVYNQGDTHFIVELPEGSQLMQGVNGVKNVISPSRVDTLPERINAKEGQQGLAGSALRGLREATNFVARSYTTWSPDWQLATGLVRDVQAIPLAIASEHFSSPWQARAFVTQYVKNLFSNAADVPTLMEELRTVFTNNKGNWEQYAKDNPDSQIAKIQRLRRAGGNTEWAEGLNRERVDNMLFKGARKAADGTHVFDNVKDGYRFYNRITSDWAAVLENKGRVAAFEAMAEVKAQERFHKPYAELTEEEQLSVDRAAAAITKGALDYGQAGEWGKVINSFHAFARVGFTQLDQMRRAFTIQRGADAGKWDVEKLRNWGGTVAAMGALNYIIMAALLGKDDDGIDKIKKFKPETLTQKLVFPIGDGEVAAIPVGLGPPQILLAPGVLGAAVATGHISPEEAASAYYNVWTRSNLPLSPAGKRPGSGPVAGNLAAWVYGVTVPTVAKPLVEVDRNVSPFDRPVHRQYEREGRFKSDSAMPGTADEWTTLAKELRENTAIFGLPGIDMYPEDIKHLVNGYGGQIPRMVARWTLDKAKREEAGQDFNPIRTATRSEVLDDKFYYRDQARKAESELLEAQQIMYSEAGNDKAKQSAWRAANPGYARRLDAKKALDKAMDAYYKRRKQVMANKLMTPQGRQDQLKRADSALREAVDAANRVIEATEE